MKKLIPILIVVPIWFYCFSFNPLFNWNDLLIKSASLLAVIVGYWFILKLHVQVLEIGWSILIYALLIDVLDEFTKEPQLWNTTIQGLVLLCQIEIFVLCWGHDQETTFTPSPQHADARTRRVFGSIPGALYPTGKPACR